MQDKYTLESTEAEFLDQSWDKMRLMLDEHMPHATPPKPSRPKYELLFLLGLFAWTVYLYWPEQKVNNTAPIEEEQIETIAQNEKQESQKTEIIAGQLNSELKIDQQTKINSAANVKPIVKGSSPLKSTLMADVDLVKGVSEISSLDPVIKITENDLVFNQQSSTLIAEEEGNLDKNKPAFLLFAQLPLKVNELNISATAPAQFPLALNPSARTRSLLMGIHVGEIIERSRYSGYTVGVFAEMELNRRFSLYSGIELNSVKKANSSPGDSNAAGDFFELRPSSSLDEHALDGGMSIYYGTAIDNEEFKVLAVNQMNYLSVPMELVFNINPSFKVNVGMSFSYLLNAMMENDERPGGWSSAEFTNDSPQFRKYGQELLGEAINRWDFAPSIGLSVRPARRLTIDLKFRNGIIDISKDDFFGAQDYHSNRYLHLGLGVDLFERKITSK